MGRRPGGWKVHYKRGWAYAYFTWAGHQHRPALDTQDPIEAETRAARAYADVVSGRLRPLTRRPGCLLDLSQLWDQWVEWKAPSIDLETKKTLGYYGDRFVDFFKSLDRITKANGATYGVVRLGQVCRSTVLKELMFLRQFVSWCFDQKAIDDVPVIPPLPKKATGKRSGKQRAKPVPVTEREAEAILKRLPEFSKTIDGQKWPIRDRFRFQWETAFRPETISRLSVPENWRRGMRHVVLMDEDDKARHGREVDISTVAVRVLARCAPTMGLVFGRHCFNKAIKRAAKAVLGEERGSKFAPYDFRHSRAQLWLDKGATLRGVGWQLGHKRTSTTDKYLAPDRRAGRQALRAG